MKKNKIMLVIMLMTMSIGALKAQVKDVSVTVSPLIEYQWWNRNINLENNLFYGLRAGFGFGPFFEIRAIAEKSLDLKGKLKSADWNIDIPEDVMKKIPGQTVELSRLGGEVKMNLLKGLGFAPYVIAGAGVQYFNYNPLEEGTDVAKYKEQQIYSTLGAGFKVNFTDRIVMSLEAKDVIFNMDAGNVYFNPHTKDKGKRLHNWAALASLDLYLGGSTPDINSSLERKIRDAYTSGFAHGLKFVVEPGVAYLDLKDSKRFQDRWFMGGEVGVDFSSLVGIRGFYYQATKDPKKLNFKFEDNLRMYGGNIIARLNQPRGIVPYLSLGAGYIDTKDGYVAPEDFDWDKDVKKSNLFAMLGGGIEIPMSRYLALHGSVNALLMSEPGVNPEKLRTPSQVHTNMMYRAGLRINLGAPVEDPADIYESELQSVRDRQNEKMNKMRSEYEKKLEKLNKELDEAVRQNDKDKIDYLLRERERVVYDSENYRDTYHDGQRSRADMMTADEFEELVERVVRKVRSEKKFSSSNLSNEEMSVVIAALNQQGQGNTTYGSNDALLNELRSLIRKMDRNYDTMLRNNLIQSAQAPTTTVITPAAPAQQAQVAPVNPYVVEQPQYRDDETPSQAVVRSDDPVIYNTPSSTKSSFLKMNRLAAITGANFGEGTSWNIGLRGYMQISDSPLDFVPELYVGVGSKTGYGVSANVFYNFSFAKNSFVKPYLGLGLGVFKHYNEAHAGSNIVLGTSLDVLNGNLFVDYSIRNLFKNNQIAVGYRFVF